MQTSYSIDQAAAFAGMKGDGAPVQDVVTGENAAAVLFGSYACLDSAVGSIKAPAAAVDITAIGKQVGVVLAKQDMVSSASGSAQYPAKSAVPVMKKGRVWVTVEDAITVGTSTVNVRYAGTGNKGAFAGAAVSSETAVLPGARWLSNTTGAGVALLEINL